MTAPVARAHHSFSAEFDVNKPIKLQGTVKRVQWINPHSWICIDVKKPDGTTEEWGIEAGTPNTLFRLGFTREALPVGTEIVVRRLRSARRREAGERPRHDAAGRPQAVDGIFGRQRRAKQVKEKRHARSRNRHTLCCMALVPVVGQTQAQRPSTPAIKAGATGEKATQGKTPWGDPDLQGTWSNQTLTPLERPAEFEDKPVLTEAEAAAYEKRLVDSRQRRQPHSPAPCRTSIWLTTRSGGTVATRSSPIDARRSSSIHPTAASRRSRQRRQKRREEDRKRVR